MADLKISELTNLTAADPVSDMLPIVDVSATPPASGSTKRISINNLLSSSPTASGALTVTGLVTAGSATITGAATVGTTLGVTGNLTVQTNKLAVTTTGVGCGIATPSNQLHVKSTSSTPALIETSGGALTYLQFTSTTGSAYIGNNANGLGFYTTGSADLRMSLAAAGDLSITSGNVVMATSGKGIDFSATAGTGTSELLNDYEEGTFLPTIVGTTTAGSGVPYIGQNGKYTKVGNLVTFQVFLDWNVHTGTGNMRIGNLPFTNGSNFWAGSLGYLNGIALTAGNIMTGYVESGQSYVTLQQTPTGGGTSGGVPIDTSGTLIFSASYTV